MQGDDFGVSPGLAESLESSRKKVRRKMRQPKEKFCSGLRELLESASLLCVFVVRVVAGGFDAAAPDLSSGVGVVVKQEDTLPVARSSGGSRDSGWSGAHDDDISLFHLIDSTTMPSRQIN